MKLTLNQKKMIIAGAGVVVVYLIIRAAIPKSDSVGTGYDGTGNGSAGNTNNTYFNPTEIANTLYVAMKDLGTDEQAIMDALQPLSAAQFQQVITKFGSKPYNTTTGNQYTCLWCENLPNLPLKTWLKEELSDDDYQLIKTKFKSLNYL